MRDALLTAIYLFALSTPSHAAETIMCSGIYDVARDGDTVSNKNTICVIGWNTQAFKQVQDFCGSSPGGICTFLGRVSRRSGRYYFIDKIVRGF